MGDAGDAGDAGDVGEVGEVGEMGEGTISCENPAPLKRYAKLSTENRMGRNTFKRTKKQRLALKRFHIS